MTEAPQGGRESEARGGKGKDAKDDAKDAKAKAEEDETKRARSAWMRLKLRVKILKVVRINRVTRSLVQLTEVQKAKRQLLGRLKKEMSLDMVATPVDDVPVDHLAEIVREVSSRSIFTGNLPPPTPRDPLDHPPLISAESTHASLASLPELDPATLAVPPSSASAAPPPILESSSGDNIVHPVPARSALAHQFHADHAILETSEDSDSDTGGTLSDANDDLIATIIEESRSRAGSTAGPDRSPVNKTPAPEDRADAPAGQADAPGAEEPRPSEQGMSSAERAAADIARIKAAIAAREEAHWARSRSSSVEGGGRRGSVAGQGRRGSVAAPRKRRPSLIPDDPEARKDIAERAYAQAAQEQASKVVKDPPVSIPWEMYSAFMAYAGFAEDEIQLKIGDQLCMLKKSPNGWCYGFQLLSKIATFPSNYAELIDTGKPNVPLYDFLFVWF